MKCMRVCPKCGGKDIVKVGSEPELNRYDSHIRAGGMFAIRSVPVERYVCCTCGYVEEWVDPEEFERSGAKDYWEKKAKEDREFEENMAYLREKARRREEAEQKESIQREQAQKAQKTKRRDDPWN